VSKQARIYWLAIVVGGVCLSAFILKRWNPSSADQTKLLVYLLAAVFTSSFKVWLPGISSTLSMNYVFIIAGLLDLHLAGGVLVGLAGVVGQTFYQKRRRVQWNQLFFNISTITLSVAAGGFCLQLHLFSPIDPVGVFSVVCASASYFAVNTLILSRIIGLTTEQKALAIWRESYLWTSPQYLVGGVVATCFHLLVGIIGWMDRGSSSPGTVASQPTVMLTTSLFEAYTRDAALGRAAALRAAQAKLQADQATSHPAQEARMTADREVGATHLRRSPFMDGFLEWR